MIKVVIFDLDGLLIDSEKAFLEIYNFFLNNYGYRLSKEEYLLRYCGKILNENVKRIIADYHLDIDFNTFKEMIIKKEEEKALEGYALMKGAKELLRYLKENNYQIILATSSLKIRAINILKKAEVLHYFNDMVCGNDVINGKPHPEVFLKALAKTSYQKDEALVLEDSLLGIEASYNANIKVIAIPDQIQIDDKHQKMCFKIYDSLLDVKEYLKGES